MFSKLVLQKSQATLLQNPRYLCFFMQVMIYESSPLSKLIKLPSEHILFSSHLEFRLLGFLLQCHLLSINAKLSTCLLHGPLLILNHLLFSVAVDLIICICSISHDCKNIRPFEIFRSFDVFMAALVTIFNIGIWRQEILSYLEFGHQFLKHGFLWYSWLKLASYLIFSS